jgi:hypothetical protein
MRLGPLRETCVQPAPRSRFASSGIAAYEDQKQGKSRAKAGQKQINSFPVKAGSTGAPPIPLAARAAV